MSIRFRQYTYICFMSLLARHHSQVRLEGPLSRAPTIFCFFVCRLVCDGLWILIRFEDDSDSRPLTLKLLVIVDPRDLLWLVRVAKT